MICRTEKKTSLSSLPAIRRRKCPRKAGRKSLRLQRLCLKRISAETIKKARVAVIAVLITIGMLLEVGAVGDGDFYGYYTAEDYAHIVIGLVMMTAGTIINVVAERRAGK